MVARQPCTICKAIENRVPTSNIGEKSSVYNTRGKGYIPKSIQVKYYRDVLLFSLYIMSSCFAIPWTISHQAPLSMGFPTQGLNLHSALAGRFFTTELRGKPKLQDRKWLKSVPPKWTFFIGVQGRNLGAVKQKKSIWEGSSQTRLHQGKQCLHTPKCYPWPASPWLSPLVWLQNCTLI